MKIERKVVRCSGCTSLENMILSRLPEKDLSYVESYKVSNIYTRGQIIFSCGQQPLGIFCMEIGLVKIYKVSDEGKEIVVRLSKGGELLGYRSFLAGEPYRAFAEAIEDSRICFIDGKAFWEVLKRNPEVSFVLIKKMAKELGDAEDKLKSLALKPVEARVAEHILLNKNSRRAKLPFNLTTLAQILGTTPESVSRSLSHLRKMGAIRKEGATSIVIINENRLLELAGLTD